MSFDILGWIVFGGMLLWIIVSGSTAGLRQRVSDLESRVERLERERQGEIVPYEGYDDDETV